jgi:hypothetical protein
MSDIISDVENSGLFRTLRVDDFVDDTITHDSIAAFLGRFNNRVYYLSGTKYVLLVGDGVKSGFFWARISKWVPGSPDPKPVKIVSLIVEKDGGKIFESAPKGAKEGLIYLMDLF